MKTCIKCNKLLGMVNENIEILNKLIQYVKERCYG